jgi:hypothetical protein
MIEVNYTYSILAVNISSVPQPANLSIPSNLSSSIYAPSSLQIILFSTIYPFNSSYTYLQQIVLLLEKQYSSYLSTANLTWYSIK